ncbi:MAG: hypothetical protein EBR82_65335 [Caulobacteraceae bacterium]|nr:hypothetical protein [Caulobacteraceae bacterium]
MISIEKVRNGFVLQINEDEEEYTIVCQQEYNSMNVALAAACNILIKMWHEDSEPMGLKVDVIP